MTDVTVFAGLDVDKKTISVAMVEASAGAEARFCGTANTPETVRRCAASCRRPGSSCISVTKQPCGYGVKRLLTQLGHRCDVVRRR